MAYSLDGFAHAVEALVGEAIGKKDVLTLRRAIAESTILAVMTASLTSILIAVTSSAFLHFMTDLPEVIAIAQDIYIWIIILPCGFYLGVSRWMVFSLAPPKR